MPACADNLDLLRDSFAVGAAVLLFVRRSTATGRVRTFLRSVGHETSSAGTASGVPGFDADSNGKDAAAYLRSHPEMEPVSELS